MALVFVYFLHRYINKPRDNDIKKTVNITFFNLITLYHKNELNAPIGIS